MLIGKFHNQHLYQQDEGLDVTVDCEPLEQVNPFRYLAVFP